MFTSRSLLFAGVFLAPLSLVSAQNAQPGTAPGAQRQNQAPQKEADQGRANQQSEAIRDSRGQSDRTGQDAAAGQTRGQTTTSREVTTTDRAQAGQRDQGNEEAAFTNKYLVTCLRNGNQAEVTISKLAAQKANDEDVKAFAQQMVKDHMDFLSKLDRIRQEGVLTTGTSSSTQTQSRTEIRSRNANTDPNPAANRVAGQTDSSDQARGARTEVRVDTTRGNVTASANGAAIGGHGDQIIRIEKEVADRMVSTKQRELNEKQGKEFDQCFMFMQVAAHSEMVDKLTVFKGHARGELQQVIEEGLEKTQQHLEHAKQLAQRIDKNDGARNAATGVERRDTSPASASPASGRRAN
jgi:predicted outer membrane protein